MGSQSFVERLRWSRIQNHLVDPVIDLIICSLEKSASTFSRRYNAPLRLHKEFLQLARLDWNLVMQP